MGVAIGNDATTQRRAASVTYGGTALTYVGRVLGPGGRADDPTARPQVEIWALANPASGSATVIVTLSGTTRLHGRCDDLQRGRRVRTA